MFLGNLIQSFLDLDRFLVDCKRCNRRISELHICTASFRLLSDEVRDETGFLVTPNTIQFLIDDGLVTIRQCTYFL